MKIYFHVFSYAVSVFGDFKFARCSRVLCEMLPCGQPASSPSLNVSAHNHNTLGSLAAVCNFRSRVTVVARVPRDSWRCLG